MSRAFGKLIDGPQNSGCVQTNKVISFLKRRRHRMIEFSENIHRTRKASPPPKKKAG